MDERQRKVARTTRRLALAAVLMFGFGFALVPLYSLICDVTGLGQCAPVVNAHRR